VCCNLQAHHVEEFKSELSHIVFFKGDDGAGHITSVHRTATGQWHHTDGLHVSPTAVTFSDEGLVTDVSGEHGKEYLSNVCWAVYKSTAVVPQEAMTLSVHQQKQSEQEWKLKIAAEQHADQQRFDEHHKKLEQSVNVLSEVTDSKELSELAFM
jgi:hypothetical protein